MQLKITMFWKKIVPFLATREVVVTLANDPIMSGRSIQSFGHLECQNPSIISESIGIPNGSKKNGKTWGTRRNLNHKEEDIFFTQCNFAIVFKLFYLLRAVYIQYINYIYSYTDCISHFLCILFKCLDRESCRVAL